MAAEFNPFDPAFQVLSRQDHVEEACATIWRLRQIHGIDAVEVEWHESGERLGDPVCTVTLRTDLDNLRLADQSDGP